MMRLIFITISTLFLQCSSLQTDITSGLISYHFHTEIQSSLDRSDTNEKYFISAQAYPMSEFVRIVKTNRADVYERYDFLSEEIVNSFINDNEYEKSTKWKLGDIGVLKRDDVELLQPNAKGTEFYERTKKPHLNENYYLIHYGKPIEIKPNIYAFTISVVTSFTYIQSPQIMIYEVNGDHYKFLEKIEDTNLY